MKKTLFSILFAGVIALMATACYPEDELAVFDSSKAVAPVVNSYEMGPKALSVSYTPGKFSMGFNDRMPVSHMLLVTTVDGKSVLKNLSAVNKDNVLTASVSSLSNLFTAMGYQEGQSVSFDAVVRATMQNPAQDNRRNGYVDSKEKISVTGFVVTFPKGSPYQDYTETSPFGVTGSLSQYDISWNGDLEMWMTADGNMHVAKSVSLQAGDEFKFRRDQEWAVNYGGEFNGSLNTPFSVSQDGPNIVVKAAGVYDLWLDLAAGTASLTEAYQAYPDHKESSNWGVIGALSEYGIAWNDDIPMLTDGTTHIAQSVRIAADDEFKFRQDKGWDVNLGGDFAGLDSDFSVSQDGPNIKIGASGVFDLILNPAAGTVQIVEALGGVSGRIGGDEPDPGPGPEPVSGWNLIGVNGDWENDIIAAQEGSLWTAYITVDEDTEFKWRKDGDWGENYGGVFASAGEPFAAVPGGDNIKLGAGFWKVVLDTEALTITISEGNVWSLIGGFNDWSGDVDMVFSDGIWVSPETAISGEFKLRLNHSWDVNRGGTMSAIGEPFDAVAGGDNIKLDEGVYIVSYDPETEKITIVNAKKVWSVIGVNGDWGTDHVMTEVAPGIWVSDMLEIESGDWKIRFDGGWDVNRGGSSPERAGQFVGAVPGGENIKLNGTFKVVYNAGNETVGTLGWGVVGSIASIPGFSWNNDIPMNLSTDGVWYSSPVYLEESDEIKIRWNASWDENFGGEAAAVNEPFEARAGGGNIKVPEAGIYMVVYDPEEGTLTVSNLYWGLIGGFNNWGGDVFMMYEGGGSWVAFNQPITGEWKIRRGSSWDVNRGGDFVEAGQAFEAVAGGNNINAGELTGFKVVYNAESETITVSK